MNRENKIRVMGIDPGSRVMGYAILEKSGADNKVVEAGELRFPTELEFSRRLPLIGDSLKELFSRTQPDSVVVEKIFSGRNVDSAFKLGHVRGICLYLGQTCGADVHEYAAREVKKGITGKGGAEKREVAFYLRHALNLPEFSSYDASDALALAYHHVQVSGRKALLEMSQ